MLQKPIPIFRGSTTRSDGDFHIDGLTEKRVKKFVSSQHQTTPLSAVWTTQVHGTGVVPVTEGAAGLVGEGDALITNQTGIVLTVRTADCVPVFITAPGVIGMVHAGYEGVSGGILPVALAAFRTEYRMAQNRVAVNFGPHLCGECMEIYGDRLKQAEADPALKLHISKKGGKSYFSMQQALVQQAKEVGAMVTAAPVACTGHDKDLYSHRRGDKGRLLSYILLDHAGDPS